MTWAVQQRPRTPPKNNPATLIPSALAPKTTHCATKRLVKSPSLRATLMNALPKTQFLTNRTNINIPHRVVKEPISIESRNRHTIPFMRITRGRNWHKHGYAFFLKLIGLTAERTGADIGGLSWDRWDALNYLSESADLASSKIPGDRRTRVWQANCRTKRLALGNDKFCDKWLGGETEERVERKL